MASPEISQSELVNEVLGLDSADLDFGVEQAVNRRRHELKPIVQHRLEDLFARADSQQASAAIQELGPFFRSHFDHGVLRQQVIGVTQPQSSDGCQLRFAHENWHYVPPLGNLRQYAFRLPSERRVVLEIVGGQVAHQLAKHARFVLDGDHPPWCDGQDLRITFVQQVVTDRANQNQSIRRACATILEMPDLAAWRDELLSVRPGPKRRAVSRLEYHLSGFMAMDVEPRFVHRDLGGTLRGELDAHVQRLAVNSGAEYDVAPFPNEDNDDLGRRVAIARLTRRCGRVLIDALAELEEIRRRHWLRRPLVLESHWCVTLDRVPAELYPKVASNAAQMNEWRCLFALDDLLNARTDGQVNSEVRAWQNGEAAREAYCAELSLDVLKAHPSLVVDTRHFDQEFTDRLLASFDDLDDATGGVAIHGDSFRALRLLEPRYAGTVKCATLDPPYNTGSAALSYPDRWDHSVWLAMMRDRLQLARTFLSHDGAMFVMLDDHEQARLRLLLEAIFGERNFVTTIVWEKVHTRKNSARHFSVSHDYILACARNKDLWRRQLLPREQTTAYANPDADPRGPWKPDPVYANKPYDVAYQIEKPNGARLDPPAGQFWRFSADTFAAKVAGDEVLWGQGTAYPMVKRYLADVQDGLVPVTLFTRSFAGDNGLANAELNDLFGPGRPVAYPKPTRLIERLLQIATDKGGDDIVLDFFAGSGTTGEAVMSQNDFDGGRRKYLLVEMGSHFETVLRPRLMKVMVSRQWRGGRPIDVQGRSHMFHYVRIDACDDVVDSPSVQDCRAPLRRATGKGNDGSDGPSVVDLIATFNFLLGVRVRRQWTDGGLCLIGGDDPMGRHALIAWRNVDAMDDDATCARISASIDYDDPPEIVYVNGYGTDEDQIAQLARRLMVTQVLSIEREFARLREEPMAASG